MSSENVEETEPDICEPITSGKEPSADFFGTTKLHSVQLRYLWKIEDLLSVITQNEHEIFTEEFASKDAKQVLWQLGLYMGLATDPNVQLDLYHIDKEIDSYAISFKAKVSILNSNLENMKLFPEGDYVTLEGSSREGDKWTKNNFLSKKTLLRGLLTTINSNLPDNSIIIFVEMSQSGYLSTQEEENLPDEAETGMSNIAKLFENSLFADAVIDVQGTIFQIHKAVLAARSPVFWAMFNPQNNTKELAENLVKIEDIEPRVFREILRFIYVGKVEDIERLACEIFVAADKYDLEGLRVICKKTLYTILNTKNALNIVQVADQLNAGHLKYQVLKFIKRNRKNVIKSKSFSDFLQSNSELTTEVIQQLLLD